VTTESRATGVVPAHVGGKHRVSVGSSTRHGESEAEHAERLRREHERLDREGVDRRVATDDYAYPLAGSEAEREALELFERERRELAGANGPPF
jgi:hypothetical protein